MPITHSPQNERLVRSIVDIGQSLNIGITAEGVESADHAAILAGIGCDRLQGYHFGRPMPLDAICAQFGLGPGRAERA